MRSDDVTVASSRSVLRAAQPLCASAVWGGQRSHFSVPPQKTKQSKQAEGFGCRPEISAGRNVFRGSPADWKPSLKWSAISKLCPQSSTPALRTRHTLAHVDSVCVRACASVASHGGKSANRNDAREERSCGGERICAGFGQPGLACALWRYRMQRRKRGRGRRSGSDCRGAASSRNIHSCAAVWVFFWSFFKGKCHSFSQN